jgi:hypothetical protein
MKRSELYDKARMAILAVDAVLVVAAVGAIIVAPGVTWIFCMAGIGFALAGLCANHLYWVEADREAAVPEIQTVARF